MPGLYTEPKSRAKPTNDPACANLKITNDKSQTGAVSYAYQVTCPNDQNLIAVIGRSLTGAPVPQPPLLDRHNIPDAGSCIRCNLEIQGTGASPDAVTIDAGDPASGTAPRSVLSRTSESGPTGPMASSSTTSRSATRRSTTST